MNQQVITSQITELKTKKSYTYVNRAKKLL